MGPYRKSLYSTMCPNTGYHYTLSSLILQTITCLLEKTKYVELKHSGFNCCLLECQQHVLYAKMNVNVNNKQLYEC